MWSEFLQLLWCMFGTCLISLGYVEYVETQWVTVEKQTWSASLERLWFTEDGKEGARRDDAGALVGL